ncbi:MAG: hypothetical protein ABJD07_15605 [Gemmatimonadaceae bacterium]
MSAFSVRARRGASRLGCLVQLLIAAVAVFAGVRIGEVYLRFYRMQDAMKQEARFSEHETNEKISAHIRAVADSLNLPAQAQDITVQRTLKQLYISAEYTDTIDLSVYKRMVKLHPNVLRDF